MHPIDDIINNFKAFFVLRLLQIINVIIKQDSLKKIGLPIVLHCKKVGTDKKERAIRLFLVLFDKNRIKKGKFII